MLKTNAGKYITKEYSYCQSIEYENVSRSSGYYLNRLCTNDVDENFDSKEHAWFFEKLLENFTKVSNCLRIQRRNYHK